MVSLRGALGTPPVGFQWRVGVTGTTTETRSRSSRSQILHRKSSWRGLKTVYLPINCFHRGLGDWICSIFPTPEWLYFHEQQQLFFLNILFYAVLGETYQRDWMCLQLCPWYLSKKTKKKTSIMSLGTKSVWKLSFFFKKQFLQHANAANEREGSEIPNSCI